jgi:chromosome segregation ATPase
VILSSPFTGSNIIALGALVAIVVALATVAGGTFRGARSATTLKNLKDAAESWETRANALESQTKAQNDEINSLKESESRKDKEIAELRGRINALQDMVTGRVEIELLVQEVQELNEAGKSRVSEVLAQVSEIRADIRAVANTLATPKPERKTRARPAAQRQGSKQRVPPSAGSSA